MSTSITQTSDTNVTTGNVGVGIATEQKQVKIGEFGAFGKLFWPIHAFELKKFIPMVLMFFCINLNYSLLRGAKDTLVIDGAKSLGLKSGAEILPMLKIGFIIPAAFLFMLLYSKLSNAVSRQKLFYYSIVPFIAFFLIFNFVLYPNHEIIHPTSFGLKVISYLPEFLQTGAIKGMIAACTNWSFSLFYVFSELWGSVALSLLFWSFANEITKVTEAKRFYTLFGIGANIALIATASIISYSSNLSKTLPATEDPFAYTLNFLTITVTVSAFVIFILYYFVNNIVLKDPRFFNPDEVKSKSSKGKTKMSIGDSLKFLANSKYLRYIAVLVFAYGISIVLIEATWKGQLGLQFPNKSDYYAFTGTVFNSIGITTIVMMLFVSGQVLRTFGWGVAALITPITLLITGIAFSGFVTFKDLLTGMLVELGTTPLFMAVIFGTVQNVMSKSSKYSLFDPTKEMTYIPLDKESKSKGKAAIDVVGARLGKAGGAGIVALLLLLFKDIEQITPYACAILLVVIIAWIYAAVKLSAEFKAKGGNTVEVSDPKVYTHYSMLGMITAVALISGYAIWFKTPIPAFITNIALFKLAVTLLPLAALLPALRSNSFANQNQASMAISQNKTANLWLWSVIGLQGVLWISGIVSMWI